MNTFRTGTVWVMLATALVAPTTLLATNWPSFRGPNASGVADPTAAPPTKFDVPTSRNVRWRVPIPGLAHSSPVVWQDRIYVTTAVASTGTSAIVTGDSSRAGIDPANDMVSHTWHLLAFGTSTGKVLWDRVVYTGVPRLKRHVKASHASATPATNGQVLVALLGSEGLFAFDMDGKLLWKQDLGVMDVGLVDDWAYQWGPASSPIIFEDLVIVQNDRHKDSFLAAFHLATGKQAWRVARDELPSWSTPLLYQGGNRNLLVTNSGKFIRAYEPRTGQEIWRLADGRTEVKIPSPIGAGGLIIVTGGYPASGRPIYAIRSTATGNVTEANGLAWKTERGSPYTPTPVVFEGLLYVCSDNGILTTYEVTTGARIYQQRLSAGAGGFSASPIIAKRQLYLTSEDGLVFVVRTGRTFELLATNSVNEVTMATPAVSGRFLILRTTGHLIGVAEAPQGVP